MNLDKDEKINKVQYIVEVLFKSTEVINYIRDHPGCSFEELDINLPMERFHIFYRLTQLRDLGFVYDNRKKAGGNYCKLYLTKQLYKVTKTIDKHAGFVWINSSDV